LQSSTGDRNPLGLADVTGVSIGDGALLGVDGAGTACVSGERTVSDWLIPDDPQAAVSHRRTTRMSRLHRALSPVLAITSSTLADAIWFQAVCSRS
jgi:hypothetical protein